MQKIGLILLFFILLYSCNSDERPYSYLCDTDSNSETVELSYLNADNASPFNHTIQSREMCISWGTDASSSEYIYLGNLDSIQTLGSVSYNYPQEGDFQITIKSVGLETLDLSKNSSNSITKLNLIRCLWLKNIQCTDQPITKIDLSSCPELLHLACGETQTILDLSDLSRNPKLRTLTINGPLNNNDLYLSKNDSLRTISLIHTNVSSLEVDSLNFLSSITINNDSSFSGIKLQDNINLSQLILKNNVSLTSDALNAIFKSLPQAGSANRVIILSGNKGDETCDRSIATKKGWIFSDK